MAGITVFQKDLFQLLKAARKQRPSQKATGLKVAANKFECRKYDQLYGSVTLQCSALEQKIRLLQHSLNLKGETIVVESECPANITGAGFAVSVDLDTLYEWMKLADDCERLVMWREAQPSRMQYVNGKKMVLANFTVLRISAKSCRVAFKVNDLTIGTFYSPALLDHGDTWELHARAPETPVCGEAPCPLPPKTIVVLDEKGVGGIISSAPLVRESRTLNLENELVVLSYIIPANTRYGTDRWIAHSGKGESHLKIDLYKEQVWAIKLAGYDRAWFGQNKPFRCHIYVILDKNRKIKEVLPPEKDDPAWSIMDGSPAPVPRKRLYVAPRKVDTQYAQTSLERAKLCIQLGLPIDASDEEIQAMQNPHETPEHAPAGYVHTIHPSELQPGDVFVGVNGLQVAEGDTFLGFAGKNQTPSRIAEGWYNVVVCSARGFYVDEVLLAGKNVQIYRDPAGYTLKDKDKRAVWAFSRSNADAPGPVLGWREDGQGGVESVWL